jgi:hypothetical protein
MNITVQIDDISLDTMVGQVLSFDEEGEPFPVGEKTLAHLVAEMVLDRVVTSKRWGELAEQVTKIRAEEIRKAVLPQIEEALSTPFRQTNSWGEPTGAETTLRQLVVEEARKAVNAPADKWARDKGTFLTQAVAAEVKKALSAEIASAVKSAREQVADQIGEAVKAGMKAR